MNKISQSAPKQKVYGNKRASKLLRDQGLALELHHARKRAKLTQRGEQWFMVLELPSGAKTDERPLPKDITERAEAMAIAADCTTDLWNTFATAFAKAGAK